MNEFFNKEAEYFWEYNYPFGEIFLKNIFGDKYKRHYSLSGDGILNLIFVDDKIYEIDFKKATKMLVADGKKAARDNVKNDIIYLICEELGNNNIEYTVNSGKYITFKLNEYIAKVEVTKKLKMPQ